LGSEDDHSRSTSDNIKKACNYISLPQMPVWCLHGGNFTFTFGTSRFQCILSKQVWHNCNCRIWDALSQNNTTNSTNNWEEHSAWRCYICYV